jgi:hypothetical protein
MQMMWAADFDESWAFDLEENCLEALDLHLPSDSTNYIKEAIADSDDDSIKSGSQSSHNENDNTKAASLQPHHGNTDHPVSDVKLKLQASHAFCGLARNIWSRNGRVQTRTISSLARKGNDELATFCVAAILVLNRQKIIRETRSFDDMIKAGALIFCFFQAINDLLNLFILCILFLPVMLRLSSFILYSFKSLYANCPELLPFT